MARSRWGTNFTKGMHVGWHHPSGDSSWAGRGIYLRLAPTDSFSRAYGKQALIYVGPLTADGKIPKNASMDLHQEVQEVGLDDLYVVPASGARAQGGARTQGRAEWRLSGARALAHRSVPGVYLGHIGGADSVRDNAGNDYRIDPEAVKAARLEVGEALQVRDVPGRFAEFRRAVSRGSWTRSRRALKTTVFGNLNRPRIR